MKPPGLEVLVWSSPIGQAQAEFRFCGWVDWAGAELGGWICVEGNESGCVSVHVLPVNEIFSWSQKDWRKGQRASQKNLSLYYLNLPFGTPGLSFLFALSFFLSFIYLFHYCQ